MFLKGSSQKITTLSGFYSAICIQYLRKKQGHRSITIKFFEFIMNHLLRNNIIRVNLK